MSLSRERDRIRKMREKEFGPETEQDKKEAKLSQLLMQFTPEEIWLYRRHIYNKAMKKDSSAKDGELFAKIEGLIIDKSKVEVKFELSADELAQRILRARRELADRRNNQVLAEPPLLLGDLCEDTGRREGDNSLAELGLSGQSSESISTAEANPDS